HRPGALPLREVRRQGCRAHAHRGLRSGLDGRGGAAGHRPAAERVPHCGRQRHRGQCPARAHPAGPAYRQEGAHRDR
ncbi:hypothetical protein KR044_000435, partial [Drosophila immigrans]